MGLGVVEFGICIGSGNVVGAGYAAGGVVIDVAATLTPFVPGGAGAANRARRIIKTGPVKIVTRRTYHIRMRDHLRKLASKGEIPGYDILRYTVRKGKDQAHHIFPKNGLSCGVRCTNTNKVIQSRYFKLRRKLKNMGIDIDNGIENLVSLDNNFHSNIHNKMWGQGHTGYILEVIRKFENKNKQAVLNEMKKWADEFLKDSGKLL